MAPLHIFIAEVLAIVLFFTIFSIRKLEYGKWILVALIVLANIFIFPRYFYPEFKEGEPQCGMPALAISILFWIVANLIVALTVGIYWVIQQVFKKGRVIFK